jgi:DNA (cytosine-5)-methyltransferase 1
MELDNVILDLENENYEVKSFIVPACAANAPHRRDRLWVVANSNSIRGDKRVCDRKERFIQKDKKWDLEKVQQEWSQFIPDTWTALTARDWFQYNRKFSRRDDGLSRRLDRIKALGNAIVPQVVYPIMAIIKKIESEYNGI